MTQLRRQLQALPSYRLSCRPIYRTTNTPVIKVHPRPGFPTTLLARCAPIAKYQCFSTSHATLMPEPRQPTSGGSPDKIIYSTGQPADLPARASALLLTWHLTPSSKGLVRKYTFSSFSKAWEFMSAIANECKTKKHHPSWSNLYNQVTVEWTTHKPEGLSIKDVEMAEFCDRIASQIGLK